MSFAVNRPLSTDEIRLLIKSTTSGNWEFAVDELLHKISFLRFDEFTTISCSVLKLKTIFLDLRHFQPYSHQTKVMDLALKVIDLQLANFPVYFVYQKEETPFTQKSPLSQGSILAWIDPENPNEICTQVIIPKIAGSPPEKELQYFPSSTEEFHNTIEYLSSEEGRNYYLELSNKIICCAQTAERILRESKDHNWLITNDTGQGRDLMTWSSKNNCLAIHALGSPKVLYNMIQMYLQDIE